MAQYIYTVAPTRMVGDITFGGGKKGGGGAAQQEADPEEMGMPFQTHFVGIAALLMMVVSLIYAFFFLKYDELPHASGSNRKPDTCENHRFRPRPI